MARPDKDVKQKIQHPQQFLTEGLVNNLKTFMSGSSVFESSVSIWEDGPPVDIRTFLDSPEFCGEKYNYVTHAGCRPKILEQLEAIVDPKIREAILILGGGSGKDYSCSRLAAYTAYRILCLKNPQAYYGLTTGDPIYIVNLSVNEEQAKNVLFAYIKAVLNNCKWFNNKFEALGQEVRFEKNLTFLSGDSAAVGWYGFNVILGILDELAFWPRVRSRSNKKMKDAAEMAWNAVVATKTHGFFKEHYKVVGISTAGDDGCFVEEEFDRIRKLQQNGEGQDKFINRLATWDVRLDQTIEDYSDDLKRDYNWAMAKFGAQKMVVGEPWFTKDEQERFKQNCGITINVTGENVNIKPVNNPYLGNGIFDRSLKPLESVDYYLHVDTSAVTDRTFIYMGHLKGWREFDDEKLPVVQVDFFIGVDPTLEEIKDEFFVTRLENTGRVDYGKIRHIIYKLRGMGFNLACVSFDRSQTEEMHQKLVAAGFIFEILSPDMNKGISQLGKIICLDGRVEMPYNKIMVEDEIPGLYDEGKKIQHNKSDFKDSWDSYCCCVYQVVTKAENAGYCQGISTVEEEADSLGVGLKKNERGEPMFRQDEDAGAFYFTTSDEE